MAGNYRQLSDYTSEYRETRSIGKRKLLTPDEILRLPLDNALIILQGQKVLKVEKYDYTLHPDAAKLVPCKSRDYIPKWRETEEQETDYMPMPPKQKRRRRKTAAIPDLPVPQPDPLYSSNPIPKSEDVIVPSDFPEEPDMIPIDKDSIMS